MKEEKTTEEQSLIDEWLAKGNKITICQPFERSSDDNIAYTHGWGKKKKKVAPKPVDKEAE